MTLDLELLYWDVLSDLASDDTGLFEVSWRTNTLFPDAPPAERRRAATEVVRRYLDRGVATLHEQSTGRPIPADEMESVLASPGWHEVPPDTTYWLHPTDAASIERDRMPADVVDRFPGF